MKSFDTALVDHISAGHNLLQSIRQIGEFKGKEALYTRQTPQILERLRQVAVIESTESSNRIEGVVAPSKRIIALVSKKTAPRDRPEQEIAGYRDVLNTIHAHHEGISFTPRVVLQLHRDLFKYTDRVSGVWKSSDNEITETKADGSKFIRFKPVKAFQTSEYMEHLHEKFNDRWKHGTVEKLVLIPAYILDFLCIHPFLDGNGRMARLLSLLLLYRAGYEVGRFISLERLIEESKRSYYDTLLKSSQHWHRGKHDLIPWTEYFLGIIIAAYKEFEGRVGLLTAGRGVKTQMVKDAIDRLPDRFKISDLEPLCPNVSREMMRVVLRSEKKKMKLTSTGAGPGAIWIKRGNKS